MAREFIHLPSFFVEAHPAAPVLDVVILDFHPHRGAHAGEGVGHERDDRAIAETDERIDVD